MNYSGDENSIGFRLVKHNVLANHEMPIAGAGDIDRGCQWLCRVQDERLVEMGEQIASGGPIVGRNVTGNQ